MSSLAIGMFDSGVGGLTVMRQVSRLLPNEHIIYMGDTARVPYGNKSPETIIRYTTEFTSFLKNKIKLLIVACNTSSSCCLPHLENHFDIPVIGVIEPGAAAAATVTKNGKIAVLGTKATIQSGAYRQAIHRILPDAEVIGISCPLLVPLVEENFLDHPSTSLIVKSYLNQLDGKEIDTILLGCTHYPFLSKLIQEEAGSHVRLVDSAESCAKNVEQLLKRENMSNKSSEKGFHHYFVSDDPHKFRELGEKLLGDALHSIEHLKHFE